MSLEVTPASLEQNNAPLLDILFNLLIFFIMACEFASQEKVKLNAPKVIQAQFVNVQAKDQLIFNLVPDTEGGKPDVVKSWRIGGVDYKVGDSKQIKNVLVPNFRRALAEGKQPQVILRADSNAPYAQIYECMGLITESFLDAGSKDPRINLSISKN